MDTWRIKGLCENCGFAYKGELSSKTNSFPQVKCPCCKKETQNFDEEHFVDDLNKNEDNVPDYNESTLLSTLK